MRIVGLVGPKRSGKSTAADVLVRERGFVSIGFADALKDLALRVNPYIHEPPYETRPLDQIVEWRGWEEAKTLPSVRRFLQELGTGVRDIDPDFWIDAWCTASNDHLARMRPVVVPDVRFANEADHIRNRGGLLIRITRPGLDSSDTHVSETEQLGIECDVEITNNGTAQQLGDYTIGMVDDWTRIPAA
jgi:hypothetical protein